jgi:hypothetical protein
LLTVLVALLIGIPFTMSDAFVPVTALVKLRLLVFPDINHLSGQA